MSHAKYSPSSAHRWTRCPGSVREEMKYPPSTNEAAIDGTHTHTLLERCLGSDMLPEAYVGKTLTDHEGDFTVDEDRAERVQVAIDYIEKRRPRRIFSEQAVNPAPFVGNANCYGTADVILVDNQWVELIDYKDGMMPVDVEDNEQLELYALGVLSTIDYPDTVTTVHMTVVQPKLTAKKLDPVRSTSLNLGDLLSRAPRYQKAVIAAEQPDAPLVPGDTQCRWCRAKSNCKAATEAALTSAGIEFQNLELAQQSADRDPNTMTDAELVELMEAIPLLRQMIVAVETEAQKRLEAGRQIEGLKLVRGRGQRSWALPEPEIEQKLRRMGIPKDAVYTRKIISPAQVEKLKWEKKKRGSDETVKKQLTERQLKMLKQEYVSHTQGKLQVALASDDRPAVTVDASSHFSEVGEAQTEGTSVPDFLK